MRRLFQIFPLLVLTILTSGCVTARKGSSPTELRLRLQTRSPENFRVRVATPSTTNDFVVANDGRVNVHVPAMGPGCSSHLFGVIQVYDKSPFAWRVVHVLRGDEVIRRLSLKQVARLPQDSHEYHMVKIW